MPIDWVTAKRPKPKKRIKVLQKIIDELNEGLELIAKFEEIYLDEAASDLELSKQHSPMFRPEYIRSSKTALQMAKYFADQRPRVLETIAMLEGFKKREIQALHDQALTTSQKTRWFCFIFWY